MVVNCTGYLMKLFYSVVKRFNRVFRPEYSVVERQGVRLLLNKNNWIDNRLLSFRRYEAENLAFILRHLQTGVYNRFIDIGANIGFFTAQALKNSPVERVMSFEPMSNNFYHLGANVLMNRGCKQVNIYPYALDRQRGKSVIHYDVNFISTFNNMIISYNNSTFINNKT